jgi:predicted Zn-dependent protease
MAGRTHEATTLYETALEAVDVRLQQLPALVGPVLGGEALDLNLAKIDLLTVLNRTPDAITIADKMLTIQPDNVAVLLVRCMAKLNTTNLLTKARQDCDAAARYDPSSLSVKYVSGIVALKAKDWQRAAREFEYLTDQQPDVPRFLFGRGIVKLRQGAEEDGRADIALARRGNMNVDADFEQVGINP